jgi:hypothetical protein
LRHNPGEGNRWWVYCEGEDGALVAADLDHWGLVEIVNGIKGAVGAGPGGSFCINEHRQVIAKMNPPAGHEVNSIHAVGVLEGAVRTYSEVITFRQGRMDPTATPTEGSVWTGPPCGATYTLAAPENRKPPSNKLDEVWTEVAGMIEQLSKHVPQAYPPNNGPLATFLAALRRQLPGGGRFRVNEHGRAFTSNGNLFVGLVPQETWFPAISLTD